MNIRDHVIALGACLIYVWVTTPASGKDFQFTFVDPRKGDICELSFIKLKSGSPPKPTPKEKKPVNVFVSMQEISIPVETSLKTVEEEPPCAAITSAECLESVGATQNQPDVSPVRIWDLKFGYRVRTYYPSAYLARAALPQPVTAAALIEFPKRLCRTRPITHRPLCPEGRDSKIVGLPKIEGAAVLRNSPEGSPPCISGVRTANQETPIGRWLRKRLEIISNE